MASLEPIAIIGMAGRFPASADLEEFRQNVFGGRDCLTELSTEELLRWGEDPDLIDEPHYVRKRPVLADADAFDAQAFEMTPRDAELRDPQYRLMLEISADTLAHAGYAPGNYPGQIGLYAGSNVNRYRYDYVEQRPDLFRTVGYLAVDISSSPDYLSTFVSYKLGLRGPSMTVLTACSTSLVAIHVACNAIRAGDCSMALAGGVDLEFPMNAGYPYQPGGIQAPDGTPRPFSVDAGGTNFGNGVGAVLLKPLSAALADNDTVYAVIRSSAVNNDGNRKVGFTAPSVSGQSECIQQALRAGDIDPATISYVEAHGTATPVGDPIEVAGLIDAFRAVGGDNLPTGYCQIGSVKSNIGHLGQAAGVAGVLKTALALHERRIPPTINVATPTPAVDWVDSPFRLATELSDWPAGDGPRRASVSSFGIGGTNAHLILEEAPAPPTPPPSRAAEPVLWSAATGSAAELYRERLAGYFGELADDRFGDAAYTLRTGRIPRAFRGAVVASDAADAARALRDTGRVLRADDTDRAVVFAFPGQGAQRPGLLGDLYDQEPLFRRGCDAAFDVLDELLDLDLRKLAQTGDADELSRTVVAQPLLYVAEYTLAHCLISWGAEPELLLGHSLGELVAGAVAGVFDFHDGLRAVAARARLMQEMKPGRMLAVPATEAAVQPHLGPDVRVAAVNGPRQVVLAGPAEPLAEVAARLAAAKVDTTLLPGSHAFHSPSMAEAAERFEAELAGLTLHAPARRIISAVTGREITDDEARSPRFWADQLTAPVRFDAAAGAALAERAGNVLEVGPGKTLAALIRARPDARDGGTRVLPTLDSTAALAGALARLWVDGEPITYWRDETARGHRRIASPGYPYERRRYWVDPLPSSTSSPLYPVALPPAAAVSEPARPEGRALSELVWLRDRAGRRPGTRIGVPRGTALLVSTAPEPAVRGALQQAGYRVLPATPADAPAALARTDDGVDHVVYAPPLSAPEQVTSDSLDEQLAAGFHALTSLGRAVATQRRRQTRAMTLTVLGRHMLDVTGGETVNPATAMLPALLSSMTQEIAGIGTRCIDLAPGTAEETLARELAESGDAPLVALRGAARWLPRLQPLPAEEPNGQSRLRQRGTYLITGGLGGLGLAIARAIAEAGLRPRLVLLGRTGLAPDDTAGPTAVAELEAAGAEVFVQAADVTDPVALAAAVQAGEQRFGPIQGVVHAAGVAGGGLFERRTAAEAAAVLAPKTRGLLNLDTVFGHRELDFLMLFSSQAALAGLFGSADYAAANAFLDAWARTAAGRPTWTVSVQWPGWSQVGMAARSAVLGMLTERLAAPIPDDDDPVLARRYAAGESWEFDEHVFADRPVLPGTALLELVMLAVRPLIAPDGGGVELRDTVFLAPVVGPGPVDVRVLVTPLAGNHRFRVQSRPAGIGSEWMEHANGTAAAAGTEEAEPLAALRGRLPEAGYVGLAEWFEFGRRWDLAREVRGEGDERLARLTLDEEFAGDLAEHPLHPAIVDVGTGVLTDVEPGKQYAPFLYRRLVQLAPLSGDVWVHSRLQPDTGRTPRPVDIDFYDAGTGELVARAEAFMLREIKGGHFGDRPAPPAVEDKPGLLPVADGCAVFFELLAGSPPPVVNVDPPGVRLTLPWLPWAGAPAPVPAAPSPAPAPAVAAPVVPDTGADEVLDRVRSFWTETLGTTGIKPDDDFFDLGGSSLTVVQVTRRIQETYGVQLSAGALFELTTARLIADEIRRSLG